MGQNILQNCTGLSILTNIHLPDILIQRGVTFVVMSLMFLIVEVSHFRDIDASLALLACRSGIIDCQVWRVPIIAMLFFTTGVNMYFTFIRHSFLVSRCFIELISVSNDKMHFLIIAALNRCHAFHRPSGPPAELRP